MIESLIMGSVVGIVCGWFAASSGQKMKHGVIATVLITTLIFIMWKL